MTRCMTKKLTDFMPLIAPDQLTLARQIRAHLKAGWSLWGPVKVMHPIDDLSKTLFHQMVVR